MDARDGWETGRDPMSTRTPRVRRSPISRASARTISLLGASVMMLAGLALLSAPLRARKQQLVAEVAGGGAHASRTAGRASPMDARVLATRTAAPRSVEAETAAPQDEAPAAEVPAEAPAEAVPDASPEAPAPAADAAPEDDAAAQPDPQDAGETADELYKRAERARRAGHRASARRWYNEALARAPEHNESLIGLSDLHFDAGEFDRALVYAKRAVRLAPRNADYRIRLGDAYYKLHRTAEARGQYEKAARLGHRHASRRIERLSGS